MTPKRWHWTTPSPEGGNGGEAVNIRDWNYGGKDGKPMSKQMVGNYYGGT